MARHSLMMAPAGSAWAFIPEGPFLVSYSSPSKRMLLSTESWWLPPWGGGGSGAPYMPSRLQCSLQGASTLATGVLGTGPKPSLILSFVRYLSVSQAGPQEAH